MASGGAWVNSTPRKVSRTGVDRSTLGDVCNDVIVESAPSPVLIEIFSTSPPCGLSGSLHVAKKQHSTSPGLCRNTQKLDAVVDINFPNNLNYVSIFNKLIGYKLSDGSSGDLYSFCRINFANDPVQNQAPHFKDMVLPAINIVNESGFLGTPDTSIRRPTDGSNWSVVDHVVGEATAVGMGAAKSDHGYN